MEKLFFIYNVVMKNSRKYIFTLGLLIPGIGFCRPAGTALTKGAIEKTEQEACHSEKIKTARLKIYVRQAEDTMKMISEASAEADGLSSTLGGAIGSYSFSGLNFMVNILVDSEKEGSGNNKPDTEELKKVTLGSLKVDLNFDMFSEGEAKSIKEKLERQRQDILQSLSFQQYERTLENALRLRAEWSRLLSEQEQAIKTQAMAYVQSLQAARNQMPRMAQWLYHEKSLREYFEIYKINRFSEASYSKAKWLNLFDKKISQPIINNFENHVAHFCNTTAQ